MTVNYTSLTPGHEPHVSRKREYMAACALIISIAGFVLQTEVLGYVSELGYQKPMMVMYVTHSCMIFLFPMQVASLWVIKALSRGDSFKHFYAKHTSQLKRVAIQVTELNKFPVTAYKSYFLRTAAILSIALNLAGASWYIAVNMTSTADLTAIFNCSTFFAYGFSVLLLKESPNLWKFLSIVLSLIGVLVIAYLGAQHGKDVSAEQAKSWKRRSAGNLVIAAGTILYGLYEVLYKKISCPPQKVSARTQAAFANFVGALIGVGTLVLMWPVLIILHITGLETFAIPSATVTKFLIISIIGNVSFSGAFLVLMSLTSPVLGSVSSLLATCTVPLVNYIIWRQKINLAEILGGVMIIAAFALMTWASLDDFVEEDDDDEGETTPASVNN